MKILKELYASILEKMPVVPPEMGGILGMEEDVITRVLFDPGVNRYTACAVYEPDLPLINQQILKWTKENIKFAGIFHSHLEGQPKLSLADRAYIEAIMDSMPPDINELYFPIVIPQNRMNVYYALREQSRIQFYKEECILW